MGDLLERLSQGVGDRRLSGSEGHRLRSRIVDDTHVDRAILITRELLLRPLGLVGRILGNDGCSLNELDAAFDEILILRTVAEREEVVAATLGCGTPSLGTRHVQQKSQSQRQPRRAAMHLIALISSLAPNLSWHPVFELASHRPALAFNLICNNSFN